VNHIRGGATTTEFVQASTTAGPYVPSMERNTSILHATFAITLAASATSIVPALARSSTMPLETPDRNKQVVRRLYEESINRTRPELLADLISDDFVDDQGGRGPSGFARNIESLRAGFPDIRFTLQELVAEGDRVAVRWNWEAKHTGTFRTWPPTGKRVTNSGIAIYRLEQGRIVAVSLETDRLGVLQQIGAIPAGVVPSGPPPSR
jgi:predicted ester cyclase